MFARKRHSGMKKGKEIWDSLEQNLRHQGAVYRVRKTSREGDAQTLAVELIEKEEVNKIVAVGGDGTVHEVVNGIYQSGKVCLLGHVAAGSGNDFSRGHGLSNDPIQAMERVESDKRESELQKVVEPFQAGEGSVYMVGHSCFVYVPVLSGDVDGGR
ncbi:MAG: diacylglycerol kinase family lipid kinase [Brevibacillus sp.]|jgi:diacylglycerol kinase family enzyme|nr:diacylglycerol kinase family lipid kinase [Brevibacillus sp.]